MHTAAYQYDGLIYQDVMRHWVMYSSRYTLAQCLVSLYNIVLSVSYDYRKYDINVWCNALYLLHK